MRSLWAFVVVGWGVVTWVTHAAPPLATARLHVLTTLAPLYSWTVNVAGDLADVENLLPADVGPHEFQFRPRDLKKVQGADLVILNGLGVETWLERTLNNNSASSPTQRLVRTSDGLKAEFIYRSPLLRLDPSNTRAGPGPVTLQEDLTTGQLPNPHVWLDPCYARHGVSNILAALTQRDPANAQGYAVNAAAYLEKLNVLDADFRALSGRLSHPALVTFHNAFPYFARRYGFDLVGVVEEIPSVSPSPKYLSELSRVITARNVRVIFTEPQYEPRLVRQLSRDLGIIITELDVLETGRPSRDYYIDGMRRNLRTLALALQ